MQSGLRMPVLTHIRQPQRRTAVAPGSRASWPAHLLFTVFLFLAFLLTAAAGVLTSNWHEVVRRLIVLNVIDQTHRPATLGAWTFGAGRFSLLDLTVHTSATDATPLFALRRLDVDLDLPALLAAPGHALRAVKHVRLTDPYARIARNPAGTWNIDDLLTNPTPSPHPQKSEFGAAVEIVGGEVVYHDGAGFPPTIGPFDEHLIDLNVRVLPSADGYLPFHLSARTATGHVRRVELTGGVHTDRRQLQMDIRFDGADLAFVQRFLPPDLGVTLLGGTASGRWELALAPNPQTGRLRPTIDIVADAHDARGIFGLSGRTLPFAVTQGRLRIANDLIELTDVHGFTDGLAMTVTGAVSHFGDPAHPPVLSIQLSTTQADARTLQGLIPGVGDLPLTFGGRVDGWVQLTGATNGLHALAQLRGLSLHSDFGDLQTVAGTLSWSDGVVALTHVRARAYDGDVTGDAWLTYPTTPATQGVQALFQGQAKGASLARVLAPYLVKSKPPPPGVPSLADLHGTVSGPVTVSVAGDRVTVVARALGQVGLGTLTGGTADVNLRLESADGQTRLALERATVETPEGQFQASGTVDGDGDVRLAVRGSGLKLAAVGALITRATHATLPEMSGTGYLSGELNGPADALAFDGTVQARDGRFQAYRFGRLSAHIVAAAAPTPRVVLDAVHLVMGNSQVICAAELSQTGTGTDARWQVAGKMTLPLTSMSALKASLGVDLPLDGFVDGEVTLLESDPAQPAGEGGFVLRRPVLNLGATKLALDSVTVNFTLHGPTVTLANTVVVYHGVPFTIDGAISLDPATAPARQLDLHIRCDALNLDNLTTLSDGRGARDLLTADGNVRLPVDLNGDFTLAADVSGQLQPGVGETAAQALTRTCAVRAVLESGDNLTVGSIPYQRLAVRVGYAVAAARLSVESFTLQRTATAGSYAITLTRPGALDFAHDAVDLALGFGAVATRPGAPAAPANLDLLRRDCATIAEHTDDASALAPLFHGAQAVPVPFSGTGQALVTLSARLSAPRLAADFTVTDLTVANRPVPDLDGAVQFDTAARRLDFTRFVATDRTDHGGTATLLGSIVLPERDAAGKTTLPGDLHLTFTTLGLRPKVLAPWAPQSLLAQMDGAATVTATLQGPTSNPEVHAALDVDHFTVGPYAFDRLTADFALRDGTVTIGDGQPAALHFRHAAQTPDTPLECRGTLPLAWQGSLQPVIPADGKLDLQVSLPKQGLDALRAFVPKLPDAPGTVEASLQISGTPAQPIIDHGIVRAHAPMVALNWGAGDNPDLPNQLTDVSVDLAFHSELVQNERINVVEVNDLSTGYDRVTEPPKVIDYGKPSLKSALARTKDFQPIRWAKGVLGLNKTKAFPKGALVAQGSVTLPYGDDTRLTVEDLPALLHYDLYAKTVRTPIRFFNNMLQGRVSGYLHLGNTLVEGKNAPLLSGVVYAENTTITVKGAPGGGSGGGANEPAAKPYTTPFNPQLSLAVQSGANNKFLFDLSPTPVTAEIPFTTTQTLPALETTAVGLSRTNNETLLSPISVDDQHFLAGAPGAKPYVDREDFAYAYTADTLRAGFVTGTYGWVSGTLERPNFDAVYTAIPNRARVRLPGGILSVETATGKLHMPFNRPAGRQDDPLDQPSLTATAAATGSVNQVSVAATMNDVDFFHLEGGRLPIDFTATSVPAGVRPPTSDEIYSALVGFNNVVSMIQGKQQLQAELLQNFTQIWLNEWLSQSLRGFHVDVVAINLDPTQPPDLTVTSQEFAQSKWGAFRVGYHWQAPPTPIDPAQWLLSLDYRMPEYRFLKNLSVSTNLDEKHAVGLNLQYKLEF